ncbi:MAG: lysophospholipid acyltransferase family protein [Bacillota bacterium]
MCREKHKFFNLLKKIAKLFCPAHTVKGAENVGTDMPSVFICNHSGAYGPIVMELFFPYKFVPWVIYNITSGKYCREYLEKEFIKSELKIKEPFSKWLAAIIAPLCIRVMKAVGAIPVYRGKSRILSTFNMSVEALMQGYNIVIFPENKEVKFSKYINDFYKGFVHLARKLYLETGRPLRFYPVYVNPKIKAITIGKPVVYAHSNDFGMVKENIVLYLRNTINEMAISQSANYFTSCDKS